jgi:hypothetical protein
MSGGCAVRCLGQAGARTRTQALDRHRPAQSETRVVRAVRFDDDHTSSAVIRVTVDQPEEGHPLSLALPTAIVRLLFEPLRQFLVGRSDSAHRLPGTRAVQVLS